MRKTINPTRVMEYPLETNAKRADVTRHRLIRRIERRDKRIAGLERKIKRLEEVLSWRTIDLESLSRNIRREVEYALCNVRMIPVHDHPKRGRDNPDDLAS